MKNPFKILVFTTLVALAACGRNSAGSDDKNALSASSSSYESTENADLGTKNKQAFKKERKIIKTGDISFETNDLEKTNGYLINLCQQLDGFVSQQKTYTEGDRRYYFMQVRVPSANFDRLVSNSTKGAKKIDDKNINAQDVTMEYIDLEARIHSKKELEKRYEQLLQKANKVSDMLEIEDKMNQLREEIESMEGQFNYLKDQIGYSSLNLKFYLTIDTPEEESEFGFGSKASDGFKNGWDSILWVLIGLTNIWPLILLFGIGGYIFMRKLKKGKSN